MWLSERTQVQWTSIYLLYFNNDRILLHSKRIGDAASCTTNSVVLHLNRLVQLANCGETGRSKQWKDPMCPFESIIYLDMHGIIL